MVRAASGGDIPGCSIDSIASLLGVGSQEVKDTAPYLMGFGVALPLARLCVEQVS